MYVLVCVLVRESIPCFSCVFGGCLVWWMRAVRGAPEGGEGCCQAQTWEEGT